MTTIARIEAAAEYTVVNRLHPGAVSFRETQDDQLFDSSRNDTNKRRSRDLRALRQWKRDVRVAD